MFQTSEAIGQEVMSTELIKSIMGTASEREVGLVIKATTSVSLSTRVAHGIVSLKHVKVAFVARKDDGRFGFNVDGVSYMSRDALQGASFMNWLKRANELAIRKGDYGQPETVFRRCN